MYKELADTIKEMKFRLLNSEGITLTKKQLSMILRYINQLEKEISGTE